MALLDAKCTNCGATLKVDGGLDAFCTFCGARFNEGKAAQYPIASPQPQQSPAAPAAKPRNHALAALVAGLASVASALLSVPVGLPSALRYGEKGYNYMLSEITSGITVCAIGIFLGVLAIVLRMIAGKNLDDRKSAYVSAAWLCSLVGLALSSALILVYLFFIYTS